MNIKSMTLEELTTWFKEQGEPAFRGGVPKARFTAFCLETQAEPNAPRKGEAILYPGEVYQHTTVYEITEA